MKTNIEQIKDNYARELGYDDWNEVIYSEADPNILDKRYNEIIRRSVIESLEVASQNAKMKNGLPRPTNGQIDYIGTHHLIIDKESITNENNIIK